MRSHAGSPDRLAILVMLTLSLAAGALAGCGTRQQSAATDADSLLASNPQERGQGDLTPQESYRDRPARGSSARQPRPAPAQPAYRTARLPSGTALEVRLDTSISSESAAVGDTWTGVVQHDVVVDGRTVIPAGSWVRGTITAAREARRGDRAMLALGLSSLTVDGRRYALRGATEPVIAGSTRARNLGAIAGSAAAGALIGRAVGGSGKGAVIGGVVGGAAATGAVAKSKGYQVVLRPGMSLTFVTREPVAIRV